jgi:acetolactate synthase-1/2/3 large subunit
MKSVRISNHAELKEKLGGVLTEEGPVLCELMISPEQQLMCSQGFAKNSDGTFTARPLEDMYPFLDRRELLDNMLIKVLP